MHQLRRNPRSQSSIQIYFETKFALLSLRNQRGRFLTGADFPMEQITNFLVPVVVFFFFLILVARKRTSKSTTGGHPRLAKIFGPIFALAAVFACGAADSWLMTALYSSRLAPITTNIVLLGGLKWLVLFGIIWTFRARLHLRNLPLFIAAVLFLMVPISLGLFLLLSRMKEIPISPWLLHYYSKPINWLPYFRIFPNNVYQLISPTALLFITYLINRRTALGARKAGIQKQAAAIWSTGKGVNMHPSKSQTTRLLCASAFLVRGFSDQILNHLNSGGRAVCPEMGVDLGVVARVCQYAKNRERKFHFIFFGFAVLALLEALMNPVIGAGILIVGGAAIYFCKLYFERSKLVAKFTHDKFQNIDLKTAYPVEFDAEVEGALPQDDQNLFIYSGFTPFIGAGTNLGGWSFTVDLSKPAENFSRSAPQAFQMEELYGALTDAIAEAGLQAVNVKNAYFVHGSQIRDDKEILPDVYFRPNQRLTEERAKALVGNNDPVVRHYKWITVHDWGQELVTSYFIRCSRRGKNMFVEINRYLLTPISDHYRGIDALPPLDGKMIFGYLVLAAVAGPVCVALSPLFLLGHLQKGLERMFDRKEKERCEGIDNNPQYNFGASGSFREKFSSGYFMHYFQKTDGDFYIKVLERTLLSSIIAFLEEHQIDTSDLRERQNMILNSGIIVHGGDVKAESLAVGVGAQAIRTAAPTPANKAAKREAA
jgi:hypothetical protein